MAAVATHKTVSAWGPQEEVIEIVYDFAVDGGAAGALDLFTASKALVVTKAYAIAETGITSGGSATVEVGISGATAGLIAQSAKTTLDTDGECLAGVANLAFSLAADAVVILTIGTAALTAGKVRFRFHVAAKA